MPLDRPAQPQPLRVQSLTSCEEAADYFDAELAQAWGDGAGMGPKA